MTTRAVVDWRVPAEAWARHTKTVRDEYGDVDGSIGRVTEDAMREYAEVDRYAGVEDRVDQLLGTGGDTSGGARTKKKESRTHRVTARVHPDAKVAFKQAADEDDRFTSYGHALAHAVSVYHDGGRAARLKDKLDRIIDSVGDAVFGASEASESEPDTDAADQDDDTPEYYARIDQRASKSNKKERLQYVCDELAGGDFTDDDLKATIKRSGVDSAPTIRTYRDAVTDILNMVRHPSNASLWISEQKANDLVDEGTPSVCRQPVAELSRSEKLRRIKIEAGRRALEDGEGLYIVNGGVVANEILDGEVSTATVRSLVKEVCEYTGFNQTSRDNSTTFRFNARKVAETYPSLSDTIRSYVAGDDPADDPSQETDDPDTADEQMSQLSQATPVMGD